MRRYLVIAVSALLAGALVVGCGKKQVDPAAAAGAGAAMTTKKAAASPGAGGGAMPTAAKPEGSENMPVRK